MKWILLFFAFWNVGGALLRLFRMQLERVRFLGRIYPDRHAIPLAEMSDLELSREARTRYRAAVYDLCRTLGMPAPDLFCSLKSGMLAGTRGWKRHQVHLSCGFLNHASDRELLAVIAHELGHIYYRHFIALRIVELLAKRDLSAGEIAEHFTVSRPAVSRHLRVLREAGLTTVLPDAQRRVYRLEPEPLIQLEDWLGRQRQLWERRLDALGTHLDRMAAAKRRTTKGKGKPRR